MDETIQALAKPNQFLYDVDFFCISDNYWLGKTKPCLTYGLRGLAYFEVSVQCSTQDLHSGVLGGTVHEAMTDLIALLNTLVDSATGEIMIPNVLDDVKPITQEEIELYKEIEFDMEMYKESSKVKGVSDKLLHKEKIDLLMARWRNPSLSIQ
jgi:nonspecific dipeptidase